jgi:hypothetical protein
MEPAVQDKVKGDPGLPPKKFIFVVSVEVVNKPEPESIRC